MKHLKIIFVILMVVGCAKSPPPELGDVDSLKTPGDLQDSLWSSVWDIGGRTGYRYYLFKEGEPFFAGSTEVFETDLVERNSDGWIEIVSKKVWKQIYRDQWILVKVTAYTKDIEDIIFKEHKEGDKWMIYMLYSINWKWECKTSCSDGQGEIYCLPEIIEPKFKGGVK